MPGHPITWREIYEMWQEWSLEKKNATKIIRKAGFRPGASGELPPTPILSIEGARRECLGPSAYFSGILTSWAIVDGEVWLWGYAGTAGLPDDEDSPARYLSPTRHPFAPPGVVEATSGDQGALLVTEDGLVYTNGFYTSQSNSFPGDPSVPAYLRPLDGISDVISARADSRSNLGGGVSPIYMLKSDGTVWGQYYSEAGMGLASSLESWNWNMDFDTPQQLPTDKVSDVIQIEIFGGLAFLKSDGSVGYWPVQGEEFPIYPSGAPVGGFTKIATCSAGIAALTEDGDIYFSGDNLNGAYGDGTFTDDPARAFNQALGGPYKDVGAALNSVFGVGDDGVLYSWGGGGPRSGRGTFSVSVNTPTAVSGIEDVESVATYVNSFAPLAQVSGGCIYTWGVNSEGALGQGYEGGEIGEPVQVKAAAAWPAFPVGP